MRGAESACAISLFLLSFLNEMNRARASYLLPFPRQNVVRGGLGAITGAGPVFARTLRATDVADVIGEPLPSFCHRTIGRRPI